MAGITVGGTTDDWILNPTTGAALKRASKLRWYAALTGGTPLSLTYNGQAVTEIPVPPGGFFPEHTWPDGVTVAYAVALENSQATDANFAAATRIKYVPPGTGGGGGVTDYNQLTNRPTLSTVAGTGAYTDLTGRPTLSMVATSGSYADLSAKPSIPASPGDIGAEVAGAAVAAVAATVGYATTASSATPTPSGAARSSDYVITAQAAAATFTAPTGTPADGNTLQIVIKDNGTARAVTWNAIYKAADDLTLPTTTVVGKTHYWLFHYNGTSAKWVYVDYRTES